MDTPLNETGAATEAAGSTATQPGDGAATTVDLLRAWSGLLNSELALARQSVRLLLLGALAVPIIALGAWLGLCALLVALAQMYTHSLVLALLIGAAVQVLALAVLLRRLRRWSHDLTLPQSRAALLRAVEKMS